MKKKEKYCPKCGAEITDSKAKVCQECGAKVATPVFKKWWFWVIVVLGVCVIGVAAGGGEDAPTNDGATTDSTKIESSNNKDNQSSSGKTYEVVDLQEMMDALEENALKAENTYQGKYVQVTGKIANFDSDGTYITIEPVDADEWNFDTAMCYIKKDSQKEFLMEKSVGDTVTIKGKIFSIGEVLGYSINIDEIN